MKLSYHQREKKKKKHERVNDLANIFWLNRFTQEWIMICN
jgi:hypothetical protein